MNFHKLTSASARQNAPAASGVYGLLCPPDRWIYGGESDNIQQALLTHLETIPSVVGLVWFTCEICTAADRMARKNDLIRRYAPVCNDAGETQNIPELTVAPSLIDVVEEFVSRKPLLSLVVALVLGAIAGIAISN